MNENWTSRTELLLGADNLKKLKESHVLVVGLGGVGAYAAEAICRAGVGMLTLVDGDVVSPSNTNRQLLALNSAIGQSKSQLMAQRLKDINPDVELFVYEQFVHVEEILSLLKKSRYDFVIDAIDTLSPKVSLLYQTLQHGYPVVSSMGAGGKIDPTKVTISDISKSKICPLARTVRKRLGKLGVKRGIQVVFSTEETPDHAVLTNSSEKFKNSTVGTISYMPGIFGFFAASVVLRSLTDH